MTYRIKDLDWKVSGNDCYAVSPVGVFSIRITNTKSIVYPPVPYVDGSIKRVHDDLESAKQAAQSHYEARMKEGLEEVSL